LGLKKMSDWKLVHPGSASASAQSSPKRRSSRRFPQSNASGNCSDASAPAKSAIASQPPPASAGNASR